MTIIKIGDFILIKSVSSRSQKFVRALVIKSHLSVWLAPQQPNIWMTTVLYNFIISYPADTAISETWKKILRSWINSTWWWREFKIFPSWGMPSGSMQRPSTSPLTWRWIARWCLLGLEFYDLGHAHMPVLAGITDNMVTETDIVSTQKVGERWSNRRMRSNFIWGQKLQALAESCPLCSAFWEHERRGLPPLLDHHLPQPC